MRTSNKCKLMMNVDDTTIHFKLRDFDFDTDNVNNEINGELRKYKNY